MFDFLWNLFKTSDTKEEIIVKNILKTYVTRQRFLRKREAARKIQNAYRYHKTKHAIRKRLKYEGEILQDIQFSFKQNLLFKLRGELFYYISLIDKKIVEHNEL